jgi:23S rRNA-intervening sequence protein
MAEKTEMVILTQTYDLLRWLLPCCEGFPKSQRFVLTERLQRAVLDFVETIYAANAQKGAERLNLLFTADGLLNTLRLYMRLARQFEILKPGQNLHGSKMINEVGKLLGGWIRQSKS